MLSPLPRRPRAAGPLLGFFLAALGLAAPTPAQETSPDHRVLEAATQVEELRSAGAPDAELGLALKELGVARFRANQIPESVDAFQAARAALAEAHGDESAPVADVWLWLGYVATTTNDYPASVAAYRRMHAIYKQIEGPDHAMTAQAAFGLGFALLQIGGEAEAVDLIEHAYRVRKEQRGASDSQTQYALDWYATALRAVARFDDAEAAAREYLRIAVEAHGPESKEAATAHYKLGLVFEEVADYDAALDQHEQALEILETTSQPDDTVLAIALRNIARIHEATGDLESALALSRRAHAIWQAAHGDAHVGTARALSDIGLCLFRMGRYTESVAAYESSLAQCRALLPEDHPLIAAGAHRLALALQDMGAYAKARPLYEEAIAIDKRTGTGEHLWMGIRVSLLGKLFWLQGLRAEARAQYERALPMLVEAFGEAHPKVAYCLRDMGLLAMEEGRLQEARDRFERVAATWRSAHGAEHRETLMAEHDLAAVLAAFGETNRARALHESVLTRRRALFDGDHEHIADSLHSLGALHRRADEHDLAARRLAAALAMRERTLGENHPESIQTMREQALLAHDLGDPAAACLVAFEMQRRMDAHIAKVLWSLTESERFRFLQRRFEALELLVALAVAGGTPSRIDQAYDAVLEWKGGATRALLATRDRLAADGDPSVQSRMRELRAVQAQLSRLVFQGNDTPPEAREAQLEDLRQRRRELELELARTAGRAAPPAAPDWRELRAALPANAAWIDFTILDESLADGDEARRVVAWIVTPGGDQVRRLSLGDAAVLEAKTRTFLEDLVQRRGGAAMSPPPAAKSPNDELREALWDPLAEDVGDATLVFVNPTSFLGGLPLETLRTADGRFLIERRSIVYLSDAAQLRAEPFAPARADLLCVGDVEFGKPAATTTKPWTPLSATATEVEGIIALHAAQFGQGGSRQVLLLGEEATEHAFRERAGGCSIVHIATHGFFEREGLEWMWEETFEDGRFAYRLADRHAYLLQDLPALFAGLVFAGANASGAVGGDAFLTAEEVAWLDFAAADLVVLSACETGLGRAQSGEGLLGLRRAFHMAGAHTVISSLWKVRDAATQDLMQRFYTNLWLRGLGKRAALRAAQLELLRANRREHGEARPSSWGAFVLSGDWR